MTSMIETALRQRHAGALVAMASLPQPEGPEMEMGAPNVVVNRPIPQPVSEGGQAPPSSQTTGEVLLVIQPVEDPSLLLRFSQRICKATGAEIAFFMSSDRGIVIKLALRSQVSVIDILGDMAEVEDAKQQWAFGEENNGWLPLLSNPRADEVIRVILKAP